MNNGKMRIAIVSDIPVEESVSGQRLLYRLFDHDDLRPRIVVEGNVFPGSTKRLSRVEYLKVPYSPARLMRTRFCPYFNGMLLSMVHLWQSSVARILRKKQVTAIVSVAQGHLWVASVRVARKLRIPVHVIVHDDWPTVSLVPESLRNWQRRMFGKYYREATSRLCVSPYMEEMYRQSYSAPGDILFPCRGSDSPEPRVRVRPPQQEFVLAYAGSFWCWDYIQPLKDVAQALKPMGGILDIYTNAPGSWLQSVGLNGDNVRLRGFQEPRKLAETLAGTADALLVPMSFSRRLRLEMTASFPSKLADYTAFGLPIMIWGPRYCSAVRWGLDNLGAAAVVDSPAAEAVVQKVRSFKDDHHARLAMAQRGVDVGNRDFSLESARQKMLSVICNTQPMDTDAPRTVDPTAR
jgi:glycosyltransferase involved in cell wall biosynthesis